MNTTKFTLACCAGWLTAMVAGSAQSSAQSGTKSEMMAKPAVGDKAKDFELKAVAGQMDGQVRLSELVKDGPVVVVVLRGYPGYQCGICARQVGKFISQAPAFESKDAKVVMIYPGQAEGLEQHAVEFLKGATLPTPLTLVIDPDYGFTNAYGLRWKAPRETAYPSAFVIGTDGEINYAKISSGHADRATPGELLAEL